MRILLAGIVVIALTGCSRGTEKPAEQQDVAIKPSPSHTQVEISSSVASVAGVEWNVPQNWRQQPPRSMRFATYGIPAAQGDTEDGECAVFFFGAGQGGDVRSNIDRWIGQFESNSDPQEAKKTVNGINVTTVSLSGTYLAPSGPMMQSQGKKQNYRLLGAIVEAPEGAVFFKATGPAATMSASEKDFDSLVSSIQLVK